MTLDEFLRWEDGTDTRYELLRGVPLAREVEPARHGMLVARLGALIHDALRGRREYVAGMITAIGVPNLSDTCYLADLAITQTALRSDDQLLRDPVLIVEVLSAASFRRDYRKRADYCSIPSVREVLLVDSKAVFADSIRRRGDEWANEIVAERQHTISLASVGIEISMAELYDRFTVPDDQDL